MSGSIVLIADDISSAPPIALHKNVALFAPGDVVNHKRHGYRGLIYDVDAVFSQSDEWYEIMASSKPSKDEPWYHILVDGEEHTTYVPQNNLMQFDGTKYEIDHPLVKQFFQPSTNGIFLARNLLN